jgi:oxidase EvaA
MTTILNNPPPEVGRKRDRNPCLELLPGLDREICRDLSRSRKVGTSLHSDGYLDRWLTARRSAPGLVVETVSLHGLDGWLVNEETGDIRHQSGRFFSLVGTFVRQRTPAGELEWDQPMIDQPEVGILGIIVKRIRGVLHFCLQAKEEPGNIGSVQLSPTVQATYSNYTRVHGGSPPPFVDYFLNTSRHRVLAAKLQTEDGGRFLFKSNRNMIVMVDEHELAELPDGFIWMTLRQIVRLLGRDNLVHACTRSVLSALFIPEFRRASGGECPGRGVCRSLREIMQWLDDRKAGCHFYVKRTPLNELTEWGMDRDGSFSHREGRFFRILGLRVRSSQREVSAWGQPILDNPGVGVIGLLTRVCRGESYYLMQAKPEPGNRGIVQVGPTVQFTPGNYIGNTKLPTPFLFDEFCTPSRFPVLAESLQSEEGARFFREAHRHRILALPEGVELDLPDDFRWISRTDLHVLITMGETVNSCARSILSLLV